MKRLFNVKSNEMRRLSGINGTNGLLIVVVDNTGKKNKIS